MNDSAGCGCLVGTGNCAESRVGWAVGADTGAGTGNGIGTGWSASLRSSLVLSLFSSLSVSGPAPLPLLEFSFSTAADVCRRPGTMRRGSCPVEERMPILRNRSFICATAVAVSLRRTSVALLRLKPLKLRLFAAVLLLLLAALIRSKDSSEGPSGIVDADVSILLISAGTCPCVCTDEVIRALLAVPVVLLFVGTDTGNTGSGGGGGSS